MATSQKVARPLTLSFRARPSGLCERTQWALAQHARANSELATPTKESPPPESQPTVLYDPLTTTSKKGERALIKAGTPPIGSRRRRAAIKSSDNIPFEQLPYQCFQEALKILQTDRQEKLKQIQTQRLRISNLESTDASSLRGGEAFKQKSLKSMRVHLEELKIRADINDPMIKKRFEDGHGDMNKPIYRYLADRKWRSYQYKLIAQRIEQLSIVPDLLPEFDPTAEVRLAFGARNVTPGEFVDSRVSAILPKLRVNVFDKGERLVTLVVVDSDVPDPAKDRFVYRCHFLANNIPISPMDGHIALSRMAEEKVKLPWLPPFAQKGSPYHRYSVFILEQQPDQVFTREQFQELSRDNFSLRAFVDQNKLKPIGVSIFRSIWDEGTAGVMQRAGIEGADVEFKRQKIEPLKQKTKAKGWEARHASEKYSWLRKGRGPKVRG